MVAIALALPALAASAQEAIDTLYTNARIYTVDENQPWAEAMAIAGGKFVAIGSASDSAELESDAKQTVDLEGKFVMPGLVDTHTHPFISALTILDQVSLKDVESLEDIQKQVVDYANANPEREWIVGGNWPKGLFSGEIGKREWLDEVVSDRPVCLLDQGGHAYWCNTKAFEITGMLEADFEAPEFSILERNEDGSLAGTVRETALGHMKKFIPISSPELHIEAARYFQNVMRENGVTANRTATGNEEGAKALKALAENDEITMHWAFGWDVNLFESPYSQDERMQQIADRKTYESEFVKTDYAKIYVDSDVNGYGIRMLEPFPGTDGELGGWSVNPDQMTEWLRELDAQGISVQFHAFGDGSIRAVIDSMETVANENGGALSVRHYPDHMVLIGEEDMARLAKLNDIIGFAPFLGFNFPPILGSYQEFLGPDVGKRIQPLRMALDAGLIVGFGTDYSSLPANQFPLMEAATHRRNPYENDPSIESTNPDQTMTLEEAIFTHTLGSAHALLMEDKIGSISVGKQADFIVLDQSLMDIPTDDISDTQVLKTVFNGEVVYEK